MTYLHIIRRIWRVMLRALVDTDTSESLRKPYQISDRLLTRCPKKLRSPSKRSDASSTLRPRDVAIQAFRSNNFDVRIARRFRQATDTHNYAPHSRVTETLTKQVVTEIAGTTDLVKRTIEIAGLHKAIAPALCLDNKYTGGSQHNM